MISGSPTLSVDVKQQRTLNPAQTKKTECDTHLEVELDFLKVR